MKMTDRSGHVAAPFPLQADGAPEFSGPSVTYFVTGTGASSSLTIVYTDASGTTTVVTGNTSPAPSSTTTTTTTTTTTSTSGTTTATTTTTTAQYSITVSINGVNYLTLQIPAPPSPTWIPELARILFDAEIIVFGSYYDWTHGTFGLPDALALGFDFGGITASFLGAPEVGIPIIILAAGIWEIYHPGGQW